MVLFTKKIRDQVWGGLDLTSMLIYRYRKIKLQYSKKTYQQVSNKLTDA